jgi:integrase
MRKRAVRSIRLASIESRARFSRLSHRYDLVPVGLANVSAGSFQSRNWETGHPFIAPQLRSWLDAVGTPIAVQQKLMRHSDIRTTLNIYGDVVTDEMAQAHSKIVGLALPRKVIAN